jgi:hypothetical protein
VGFAFLDEAFAADYASGVTAFVTQRDSVGLAEALVGRFASHLEERGRVQARPTEALPLLAGDVAGRQLAVFAAGSRVCGVVGTRMAPVAALAKLWVDRTALRSPSPVEAVPERREGKPALPAIALAGWQGPDDVRTYTSSNLWEKIDGRADLYLAYEVVGLTFGTYRDSADATRFADVYWYDMGEPDNAFGVYRAELGDAHTPVELGREGYTSPGGVFFWKGGSYVRVEASDATEDVSAVCMAIARAVASAIVDEGRPLWADALLPSADRIEGSFAYHASNVFSLEFLSDVFSADYEKNGVRLTTFVHRGTDAESVQKTFDAYGAFFDEYGTVIAREAHDGFALLVGESGGIVDAVFVHGLYLGGASGSESDAVRAQAIAFAERVIDEAG